MRYALHWSRKAEFDIIRLHAFLHKKNPAAAWRVIAAIQNAAHALKSFPYAGKPVEGGGESRQIVIPFADTSYMLRYRVDEPQAVFVFRVWNSREDWLNS